jgi:hypothetical protein
MPGASGNNAGAEAQSGRSGADASEQRSSELDVVSLGQKPTPESKLFGERGFLQNDVGLSLTPRGEENTEILDHGHSFHGHGLLELG